ncbi:ABC transporter ATP-binding protein [Bacillus testis]|uniref:ABC transporter ATP-binding protein n=1 Tax=Bacillus testis TaxID=1622072 RepID=UPI00067E8FD3|nr:ABC transporter ATP-binding protein [Bacillus testis]
MDIIVKEVTKKFPAVHAVDRISFHLQQGRCVALIGSNGAGKSTLLKMIAGLIRPTAGTISLHQEKDWKRRIGYLPQAPHFFEEMKAVEFLRLMGGLSGMEKKELLSRMDEVMEITGISHAASLQIAGFSGGMKQRLGIAQAILHRPDILLLDEPVSALDPIGRRECMDLLSKLKKTTTILYSTHVLHDAEEISDDVLLMRKGKLVAQGTLESLLSSRNHTLLIETATETNVEWDACPLVQNWEMLGHRRYGIVIKNEYSNSEFLRWCLDRSITIRSFSEKKYSLEDVFMEAMKIG